MRVLNQLPVPQDSNPEFLFGAIKNETDTEDGTPVVREVYNDILQNLYKLLDLTNITPTGTEDSEVSQYQIVDALRALTNDKNDIEQVLSYDLSSLTWSIGLPIDNLPNKYFVFARATENYTLGNSYSFKGSDSNQYPFTSNGFKSGDELLIIIDQSGVRAYSLTSTSSVNEVFTVLGLPLSCNNSNIIKYQEDGKLMGDLPSVDYIEQIIRNDVGDSSILVNDMFIVKDYLLCFCFSSNDSIYFFRQFNLSDLSVSENVDDYNEIGQDDDYMPYVFVSSDDFVYMSNSANKDIEDYSFKKFNYLPESKEIVVDESFLIDATYIKTSNSAIVGKTLYALIDGNLKGFSITDGDIVYNRDFSGVNGQLFIFNRALYFSSGEVARKWF